MRTSTKAATTTTETTAPPSQAGPKASRATTTTAPPAPTAAAPAADGSQYPNQNNTGVPAGWAPAEVRTESLRVTTPGAVIQDIQFDAGDLEIAAPNVTVRRVRMRGGVICNWGTDEVCNGVPAGAGNGLVVEDSTIEPAPGRSNDPVSHWKIGPGGFTMRRTEILNSSGGIRVGGDSAGMGPVVVENSFFQVRHPDPCGDWHGEGIQGYDGAALTLRHSTIDMEGADGFCAQGGGTAPFFYPSDQGNTSVDIDGLLIAGPNGNYSFRNGTPGRVVNLHIEDSGWSFGPILVLCSAIGQWQADIVGPVNRTAGGYQLPATVRAQPCDTTQGF